VLQRSGLEESLRCIHLSYKAVRRSFALVLLIFVSLKINGAEPVQQLRLGHFPNITHGQAIYARATGDFEKALGIKIKWTSFNAGPTAIESLFTDAVDATFVGPSPTINGFIKSRGEKFVVIAGSASGGAGLVVRNDVPIANEKDFHDKVIATPQLGNTQDVAARVWFAEKGYRMKERGGDLTLVALSNPDQLTLFKKKQIDGAWTVEPWMSRLELEGGGKVFLEESTLWPEGRYVTTHLVVNKAFLAHNPELIRKLLTALVDASLAINADKAAAAKIMNDELKKETGKSLKPEVLEKAMKRVEFTWDPVPASLRKSADALHTIGFLRKTPDLNGIYSLDPLNQVLAEKHLPAVNVGTE